MVKIRPIKGQHFLYPHTHIHAHTHTHTHTHTHMHTHTHTHTCTHTHTHAHQPPKKRYRGVQRSVVVQQRQEKQGPPPTLPAQLSSFLMCTGDYRSKRPLQPTIPKVHHLVYPLASNPGFPFRILFCCETNS